MATREAAAPMAFYLAYMVGDRRGYILNRDEYYLKDDREDLLKFNKWAQSLGKTIKNPSQKEQLKKQMTYNNNMVIILIK
jgi:CHASE3 domain sensor protein